MPYISLYRKYRSQTFDDVVGQDHVIRTLKNAIKAGHVSHGYLFCGSRGTGKTTVARLVAKALNCANGPTPEPCNQCEACVEITNGNAVDVIEVDGASNRKIEHIREITDKVRYAPMRLRYKVYIIDEAHQVTHDAKDAFLKTLEEPPPHAVFILATTESGKIPLTIRSRCQQFDFRRGSVPEVSSRLKHVIEAEALKVDDDAVELIARSANGSYRDSLSLLEQVMAYTDGAISAKDVYAVLGMLDEDALLELGDVISGTDTAAAFDLADRLMREGRDVRELLKSAAGFFRDLLALKVGADDLHKDDERWRGLAELFPQDRLVRVIDVFSAAEKELKWSEQHRLGLEMAILKAMARPKEAAPVAEATPAPTRSSRPPDRPSVEKPPVEAPEPKKEAPAPVAETVPTAEPEPAPEPGRTEEPEEAAAPVEEPEAPAAVTVTLPEIQREWQRILRHASKVLKVPQAEAVARDGRLLGLTDSVLTIGFPAKNVFHQQRTHEHAELLSRAIREVLKADVKIRSVFMDEPAAQQPAEAPPAEPAKPEPEQHPMLNDVVTMFDGTVVQDDHDPWEEEK